MTKPRDVPSLGVSNTEPCIICDNEGDLQPGDIEHITEHLMLQGYLEEVRPGEYRLSKNKVHKVLGELEAAENRASTRDVI